MGIIKPSFTLTANSSKSATNAGPLSMALSLSATDSLSVDVVKSEIVDVDESHTKLLSYDDYTASGSAGTDGAWIYIKNITAEGSGREIYIGVANEHLGTAGEADRLFTLPPQEWAWFPWDCTQHIYEDANGTTARALEYWVFVRTGTA